MVNFLLIVVIILILWILFQMKSAHHHLGMYVWIAIVLFLILSVAYAFKGVNIDFKSASGIESAFKIYVSWLGHAFQNVKTLTGQATQLNWRGNSTATDEGS
jgi:hypothetical protein